MINEHVRRQTLGFVRACVFLIWLVKIIPDPFFFLAELPFSIFKPSGVLRLVPTGVWQWLLDANILSAFKVFLVLTLILAMIGVKPYRLIAVIAAILLTVHQGLVRSFTFVNHQELGLLFCVYALAVFPAADGFSWPKRKQPVSSPQTYAGALLTMTLLVVLPYCAIGAYRLVHAAPAIFFDDSLPFWLGSLSGLDADGWSLGLWVLRHPMLVLILKVGFLIITFLELLAPLCLILPRFLKLWLAVIIPFHFLSWFLLNIFFWENLLLIALLMTNVDNWFTCLWEMIRNKVQRKNIPHKL